MYLSAYWNQAKKKKSDIQRFLKTKDRSGVWTSIEIIQNETKNRRADQSSQELIDNVKQSNTLEVSGGLGGEEEKGTKEIFEENEDFWHWWKTTSYQSQKLWEPQLG